jgi:hypothetical protein
MHQTEHVLVIGGEAAAWLGTRRVRSRCASAEFGVEIGGPALIRGPPEGEWDALCCAVLCCAVLCCVVLWDRKRNFSEDLEAWRGTAIEDEPSILFRGAQTSAWVSDAKLFLY